MGVRLLDNVDLKELMENILELLEKRNILDINDINMVIMRSHKSPTSKN